MISVFCRPGDLTGRSSGAGAGAATGTATAAGTGTGKKAEQ
jgi:hypothetical protein